jgi:hypothetical protein
LVLRSWVYEWNGGLLAPVLEMAPRILMAGTVIFGVAGAPSPPLEKSYPPPSVCV